MKNSRLRCSSSPLNYLLAALALTAIPLRAADNTWTGATSNVWNLDANWAAGPFPTTGEDATFNAASANTTVSLSGGVNIGSIIFDTSSAAAYTIGSGAVNSQVLTLGAPGEGVFVNSGVVNNQLFNSSISLGAAGTYQFVNASPSAGLTFAGGLTAGAAGTSTLDVSGAGAVAFSGIIGNGSGTVGIQKSGAGTLTLSGANTFTGPISVTGGTISIAANNHLGANGAALTLNGGTLRTTHNNAGGLTNAHSVTIGAGGGTIHVAGPGVSGQNSRLIFNTAGLLTGSGALTVAGNGALDAAGGSGVLVLNQANSGYTGAVTLQNGGMIEVGNNGALGTGATVSLGNNGGLNVNNNITFTNGITVNGSGSVISFSNGGAGVISGSFTLNNSVTIGLRNWYNYGTIQSGTITSTITGAHDIFVNSGTNLGTGATLTLGGFDAKASAGNIVLNAASLALNSNSGTAAASVTRANSLTINSGNLTVTGVASQNTNDVFGTLNLGGGTAGNLSGLSTITFTPNAATNTSLTFTNLGTRAAGIWVAINTTAGTFGGTPGANTANLYFTNGLSGSNLLGAGGSLASGTASVIPWLTDAGGHTTYGYDATTGVGAITRVSVDLDAATAGQNVIDGNGATLTADRNINSLAADFSTFNFGGNTLTVASGVVTADNANFNNGTLNFGTAEGRISVHQVRQLNLDVTIAGSGGLTFVGFRTSGTAGRLRLGGANTYTGVTNFYGSAGNTAEVYLTNSLALRNTTLNHVANRNYNLIFGNGGTTGQTAYTFGGLTGNANLNLNNNNTTVGAVALTLGSDGTTDTAATVNTYSGVLSSTVAGGSVIKEGVATQVFTGANTYDGGTFVNGGVLLLNNTSGSGVGTGAVAVNSGGTLGGTGFIAQTGAAGITVNSGGFLAPGASIGTLTLNMSSTTGTVQMLEGAGFKFELGTAGASLASVGTSDLLLLTGAAAGDLAFNNNQIDFLGTGAVGYYKLFDTSLDATTYAGLTFDSVTGLVSSGLTAANLAGGLTGEFIIGTAENGAGSIGDIYFSVVPEPTPWMLIAGLGLGVACRRRRRQD